MKKEAIARVLTDKLGFKKKGAFYIGTCNDWVIAGYGLDAAPSATYITKFAVPAYDNIEFMHFGLGKRILTLPSSGAAKEGVDLVDFLRRDWSDFSKIEDCESLIRFIDAEKLVGVYALWARYLTYIQCKNFDAAERLCDASVAMSFAQLQAISKHFAALSEAKSQGGWEGCLLLLDGWRQKTKAAYC